MAAAAPPPPPQLLLLAALAGLLGPGEVVTGPAEEAGADCPEGLWPLPPQVSPRVIYTRVSPVQPEAIAFLYHPCAHPWLKLQLALLAHASVPKPWLVPDSSLPRNRPVVLRAWGLALEMAWIQPSWAAHWLKRRRWRKQTKKKVWFHSEELPGPSPPGPGRPCVSRCTTQALTLAPSWSPPHAEVTWRGPRRPSRSEAKRRGLRAALGPQPTPSGLRFHSPSPKTWKLQQPETLEALAKGSRAPGVPAVPLLHGEPSSNASSGTGVQEPTGKGNPRGCACPTQASLAPRAAAPPRAAQVPTPRTEEAAWAAMALTFLLVLLTLATLCTRLHRNFRRGESIYWGPAADSQDTVAAVLKRRLLMPPRRSKRSRRRPLLPPTPDSGPDGDSSD